MISRLERYRKVVALANKPSPFRRAIAAVVAGALAFAITQLCLGVWWGAGWSAVLFSSVALGVAAAVAAATMKRGMAVAYGVLGAVWLLLDTFAAMLGSLAAGLG